MLGILALLLPPALFDAPTVRGATVTAYVVDAASGKVLYERDADTAMMPASTFKLLVGSASADLLGDDFAFTTTLATDGTSLYLRGSGDPLLKPSDFDDAAKALTAANAATFDTLIGDDSAATRGYPDGWSFDDLPFYYGAPPDALSIDENAVRVRMYPTTVGAPPRLVPPAGLENAVTIENDAVTVAAKEMDTTELRVALDKPNTLVLSGDVPADETDGDLDVAMLQPAWSTLTLARAELAAKGIAFTGDARMAATPATARTLWTHTSEPLPVLLRSMWWPSDNLLAESLLNALGPTRGAAIKRERDWLRSIGIDNATISLADGSGLSNYDRITARDEVAILTHDWNGPHRAEILAALPVGGEHGTLAEVFKNAPFAGNVIAKTGSVNHTRTLAGYMMTPHGTLIFALMVNGWMDDTPQHAANLRAFQESFMAPFFQ
jgi:serine-type D-Ala-D-Ala carboxypeptidase/endopeptidase (penicillin-binding protein 4)